MKRIYRIIRSMGVTSKYNGYYFMAEAALLAAAQTDFPIRITKDIYPVLARKYNVTPENVERGIRTVIAICWDCNRPKMEHIAGCPLYCKPTNGDFVDMLAYYLLQEELPK